ncbi:MAG: DoxX family protein [Deinococcales bacterium]
MKIALWVIQILLAFAFIAAGAMKATQPKEKLAKNMGWVNDFSANTVKLIGILEVLGGLGLILPSFTGIMPWLTRLAALGLPLP